MVKQIHIPIILILICLISEIVNAQKITLSAELDTLTNTTGIRVTDSYTSEITFTNPVVFADDELLMGEIVGLAKDRHGNLYIADSDLLSIHQFDKNGVYQTSIGRDGEGPGEFRSLIGIEHRNGSLYSLDRNLNRINIFNTESLEINNTLGLSGESNSSGMGQRSMPETFFVLPNERILLTFMAFSSNTDRIHYQPVDILNSEGMYEGADQIKIPTRQSIMRETGGSVGVMVPPYGRKSTLYASESGNIYTNWSENLLIKQYDEQGNYQQSWFYDIERPALTRRGLSERYSDAYMQLLRGESLPDTWPAVRTFLVDDHERLWISLYSENLDDADWIVVGPDGAVLSRFTIPSSHAIEKVSGDEIYIIEEDEEGFDLLKRYRFFF